MPIQLDDYSKYAIPIALGSLGAVGAGTYLKHVNAEKRRQRRLMAMAALLAQEEGLEKTAVSTKPIVNTVKGIRAKSKIPTLSISAVDPTTFVNKQQKQIYDQLQKTRPNLTEQDMINLGYRGPTLAAHTATNEAGDMLKIMQNTQLAADKAVMQAVQNNPNNVFIRGKPTKWQPDSAVAYRDAIKDRLVRQYYTDPASYYESMKNIESGVWNGQSAFTSFVDNATGKRVFRSLDNRYNPQHGGKYVAPMTNTNKVTQKNNVTTNTNTSANANNNTNANANNNTNANANNNTNAINYIGNNLQSMWSTPINKWSLGQKAGALGGLYLGSRLLNNNNNQPRSSITTQTY